MTEPSACEHEIPLLKAGLSIHAGQLGRWVDDGACDDPLCDHSLRGCHNRKSKFIVIDVAALQARVEAVIDAGFAIAKRRFVGGDRSRLQACWCEGCGDSCVNQAHCEKARAALAGKGKGHDSRKIDENFK